MKAIEHAARSVTDVWHGLSLDARVVGLLGMFNWLLLFGNHTTVAATRDLPLWRLFPPGADVLFLIVTGCAAATYVLRDHASHGRFTFRQRAVHLALTLAAFTVVPTIASFVLRVTGEPYANYVGYHALDVRTDLGGLNLSTVPKVFIECGNMRNGADAAKLSGAGFRQRIAVALAAGLTAFLSPGHG